MSRTLGSTYRLAHTRNVINITFRREPCPPAFPMLSLTVPVQGQFTDGIYRSGIPMTPGFSCMALNCVHLLGGKMRDSFRSSVVCLLAIACLLVPVALIAADSSATTTADPTNAATSAAPTNSGANVGAGAVINPTLVDLLVKKGILTTSEANSLRTMSGSAGMQQLLLLLKAKGIVNDSEAAELKS